MKLIKEYYSHFFVLVLFPVIGFLLLMLIYTIPVGPMRENINESLPILQKETTTYEWGGSYLETNVSNYTNTLMMSHVVFNGDMPLLKKVALIPYYRFEGETDKVRTLSFDISRQKEPIVSDYNRYWHGWLLFQKPMYYFFNFGEIRQINSVLQLFLLIFVLYLLNKKGSLFLALSYLTMVMLLNITTLSLTLQLASVYYLMLITTIVILYFKKKLFTVRNASLLFLVVGMLCSYFDLLTFPLVTWGIPLLTLLYFYREETISNLFKIVFATSVAWSLGYGIMWVSKWILAYLVLHDWTIVERAIQQVFLRSSSYDILGQAEITRFQTIKKVLKLPIKNIKTYIMLIPFITLFVKEIKVGVKRLHIHYLFISLLISLAPFVWYMVIVDHSYIHPHYAYRLLAISLYAGLLFVSSMIDSNSLENKMV